VEWDHIYFLYLFQWRIQGFSQRGDGFPPLRYIFKGGGVSCDIVALRKILLTDRKSYDSFSAKSCVLLAHGLGVYFSIPIHNLAQSKVSTILKTFTYYSHTITNLTKFDFPLSRDQTSRSRIWHMISEKFKCVTFKAALDDVRYS
jgi:hypothetical protein